MPAPARSRARWSRNLSAIAWRRGRCINPRRGPETLCKGGVRNCATDPPRRRCSSRCRWARSSWHPSQEVRTNIRASPLCNSHRRERSSVRPVPPLSLLVPSESRLSGSRDAPASFEEGSAALVGRVAVAAPGNSPPTAPVRSGDVRHLPSANRRGAGDRLELLLTACSGRTSA